MHENWKMNHIIYFLCLIFLFINYNTITNWCFNIERSYLTFFFFWKSGFFYIFFLVEKTYPEITSEKFRFLWLTIQSNFSNSNFLYLEHIRLISKLRTKWICWKNYNIARYLKYCTSNYSFFDNFLRFDQIKCQSLHKRMQFLIKFWN